MTKLVKFISYLQAFAAPLRAPGVDALGRPALIAFIDEAIQEAAKILIEAREPWMMTEWTFDVVANQKVYPLYLIAPPATLLKDSANYARPHTLFVSSVNGDEWLKYEVMDKRKALMHSRPKDKTPSLYVYLEVRPGHGGATGSEGDPALVMENPPNYSMVAAGRLSVYILPRELASNEDDGWEPQLPPIATTFVKRHSLRLLYQALGKQEAYKNMEEEMAMVEVRLRSAAGSGISDDPQHVHWEQSVEDYGY